MDKKRIILYVVIFIVLIAILFELFRPRGCVGCNTGANCINLGGICSVENPGSNYIRNPSFESDCIIEFSPNHKCFFEIE